MFEKQIEQMFGKRVNLETQIFALESAATNKEVISAMQQGKNAIDASLKSLCDCAFRDCFHFLIVYLIVMWITSLILWMELTKVWLWSTN